MLTYQTHEEYHADVTLRDDHDAKLAEMRRGTRSIFIRLERIACPGMVSVWP